jgi:hypothetical protein
MGTSVLMIERHYSHLKVIEATEQLRGQETRRRIASTSTVEEIYHSAQAKKKAELLARKIAPKKTNAKVSVKAK